jgi:N-acetyl sugar amidotransferase
MAGYRICTRCIMDTSDPDIVFDAAGVCNRCTEAISLLSKPPHSLPPEEKRRLLDSVVSEIKAAGKGAKYDCIIGVSGGVDSSYVAYKVHQLGLRPLAVHLDNGWNSKIAVTNVENALRKMGIDLFTHVIDWEEFKDLQLSFLKASTPDSEIPSDHAIFSILYHVAARHGVKYIIAGMNTSTESILPRAWSQGHTDWKYIRSVHARFGSVPLKTFPHRSLFHEAWFRLVKGIRWVNILDLMEYRKQDALKVLQEEVGWESYGGKHHESIYTRFFQAHILPTKFGYDKRRAHLSSLIASGQITREKALEEMEQPLYAKGKLQEDLEYAISKFGLTEAEFEAIMKAPPKSYQDYPNIEKSWYYGLVKKAHMAWRKRNASRRE